MRNVFGITSNQLAPQFWLDQLEEPDRVIMDAHAVDAHNARVIREDPHIHDLAALPVTLQREVLVEWISAQSRLPQHTLYDARGNAIARARLHDFVDALALDTMPASRRVRHGLIVQRTPLRRFPTLCRVFRRRGDTDLDRFQECTLAPGTPVAILHPSRDGEWQFLESPHYRGWVQQAHLALGNARCVLDHPAKSPFLVITEARASTVFSPEAPALSALPLDMGTRIPFDPGWPDSQPVNGQGTLSSFVVELPSRGPNGRLQFARALLPRSAGVHHGYLPLTRANIIRQAFKFLGERYGWGGAYEGRDCSGFVSDVYRSMGILMPRNSGAQSHSPAANRIRFDKSDSLTKRIRAIRNAVAGDLVYTPDHVMMLVGHLRGQPYVIHDVIDARWRDASGRLHHIKLNTVAVTPLLPLLFNSRQSLVERMTAIVRFRRGST